MAQPTQPQVNSALQASAKRLGFPALVLSIACAAASSEGIHLDVYDDGLGIPTTCFGQTGPGVKFGQPLRPLEECTSGLLTRIQANQDYLAKKLPAIPTPAGSISYLQLTDGEMTAYNLLLDNLGPGAKGVKDGLFALKATGNESTMMTLLRQGKRREACQQIMQWLNPKWLPGIKNRRIQETALCLRDLGPA